MKNKILKHVRPVTIMVALMILMVFSNSTEFSYAVPSPTPTDAPEPKMPTAYCVVNMGKFIEVESGKYRKWMKQHFENKSSTTSLLDTAFGKYSEFRKSLYIEYAKYYPQQGALQLSEGLAPNECLNNIDKALVDARSTLRNMATSTSTVKKTTALLTKYQDINAQLRNLDQSFLTMKKHLDSFADALPCYISKACNKG